MRSNDNPVNEERTAWSAPPELHPIVASGDTLWRRIALLIARDVCEGRLAAGSRLPSEHAMADAYGVNRHTIRQAIQRLVDVGYLDVRRGRGSFVRARVIEYPLTLTTRFSRNMGDAVSRSVRELIDVQWVDDPAWLAPLCVADRGRARWLQIRSSVHGRPLSLTQSVFPSPRFDAIADVFIQTRSVGLALERFGVRNTQRQRSTISARMPTTIEADWLQRPPTLPVLVVDFLNVDGDGQPVEAGQTVFASDAVHLVVEP